MGKLTGQVHIHMCLCFMPLKQLIVQGHFTSIDARSLGVCQDHHHVHHVCYLVYGYGLLVYCLGSTTSATCVTPNKAARQSSKRSGLRAEGLGFRVHSMRALSLSLSLSLCLSLSHSRPVSSLLRAPSRPLVQGNGFTRRYTLIHAHTATRAYLHHSIFEVIRVRDPAWLEGSNELLYIYIFVCVCVCIYVCMYIYLVG